MAPALVSSLFLAAVVASSAQAAYLSAGSLPSGGGTSGVAVNQTSGDVYGANLLGPEAGFGTGGVVRLVEGAVQPSFGPFAPSGVAVNPLNDNVFVFDSDIFGTLSATIQTYAAAGGSSLGSFPVDYNADGFPQIAADAAGNVYYPNDLDDTVEKFAAAGGAALLTIDPAGANELVNPSDVAVDALGNVYVVDGSPPADPTNGRLQKFDALGNLVAGFSVTGDVASVAVHGDTGDVFVGKGSGSTFHIVQYSSAGSELDDFGAGEFSALAFPGTGNRIAVDDGTGTVYASDPGNDEIEVFAPPQAPDAITDPASGVTQTAATLNGTVDANGDDAGCEFQYTDEADFQANAFANADSATCDVDPVTGSDPTSVSADVTGLAPDTTYRYRVSATNGGGTADGTAEQLTTLGPPPAAATASASAVTQTAATLNGTVDPNGAATACEFEYGPTAAYGQTAPCTSSPGSGADPVAVSADLTGLTPGTTYHFRLKATSANGTVNGADGQLTTLAHTCATNPAMAQCNCPAVQSKCSSPPPPSACPADPAKCPAGVVTAAKTARVKSGKAIVKIACTGPANAICAAGKLSLKAKVKRRGKSKRLTIGKASFRAMDRGDSLTLKVKLSGPAKAALRRSGKLKASIRGDVAGKTTLKGKKAKRGKAAGAR